MKSGIIYEQGDILIAPFPFTDLTSTKQRPILVLSNKEYNSQNEDLITCGITSNKNDGPYSVIIENKNLETGTLPLISRIKVDKLFTLHKTIIKKRIAKINNETLYNVKKELFELI